MFTQGEKWKNQLNTVLFFCRWTLNVEQFIWMGCYFWNNIFSYRQRLSVNVRYSCMSNTPLEAVKQREKNTVNKSVTPKKTHTVQNSNQKRKIVVCFSQQIWRLNKILKCAVLIDSTYVTRTVWWESDAIDFDSWKSEFIDIKLRLFDLLIN